MAKDLNKVILIGRLTRDVDFGFVGSGTARASFALACSDSKKNGGEWVEETYYFNCVLFGKSAENLKQYLTKGQQVAIEGKLKQDRYEKDGQKHSFVSIFVESLELLGGKKENNSNSGYVPSSNGFQPLESGDNNPPFPEDMVFEND